MSDNVIETYPVKGESLALWIPLLLALFGIVNSIFIAQSFLSSDLKIQDLLTPNISEPYEPKAKTPSDHLEKKLSDSNIDKDDIQDSKPFDADIKRSIATTPTQDIKSDKETSFVDPDTVNDSGVISSLDPKKITAGKALADLSNFKEQEHFDGSTKIAKIPKNDPMNEKGFESNATATVVSKSPLVLDCPPLFFFTFSRGSETPAVQKLMPKVKRLKNWIAQHPDKKVFIEGHTDSYGPDEYNLLLSYRRAKAVEKALIQVGISKNQLTIRAFGEDAPLPGKTARSKKNRRASIRLEAHNECMNDLMNGESN